MVQEAHLHAKTSDEFRIGQLLQRSTVSQLTPQEVAAYDAPFPDEANKAGARAFPQLVPVEDGMDGIAQNIAAWERLAAFDKPFLTLFGEDDPVLGANAPELYERIVGAKGQPHGTLSRCGHFCQEDRPVELAQGVIEMAKAAGVLN